MGVPSRVLFGSLLGATAGCDFPISGQKYEVVPAPSEEERVARIVRAFAAGDPACEARLLESCRPRFEACAGVEGCTDFAVCVRDIASPDAYARCSTRGETPFEAIELFTDVRECWATAVTECGVGTDFRCVGNYTAPTPQRSPLVVAQQFDYAFLSTPIEGARVRFCARELGCELLAETTTDEAGRYQVSVPILFEPPGLEGFRGVRRVDGPVDGPEVFPALLARNVPIWTDHAERTSLASVETVIGLAEPYDVELEQTGPIVVQAFDCQTGPAGGLVFEVPTDPDAIIVYLSGPPDPDLTSTAPGVGTAMIVTKLVDWKHRLVARREAGGEVVATGEGYASVGEALILSLQPEPVE